jgi:hypothetical protein
LGRGLGNPLGQFFRRVVCEGSVEATHRRAGGSPGIRAARDYYDAIERGALNSRIADAELATAKAVVSSPKTIARSSAAVGKYRRRRMGLNGHEQGYCIFSA